MQENYTQRPCSIFILVQMPWEDQTKRTIRLCVPGVDRGMAGWLEAEVNADGSEQLLERVHTALSVVRLCRD